MSLAAAKPGSLPGLDTYLQKNPAGLLLVLLLLTLLSAIPRFYGLGSLGFYGDEETMALPARSLASGGKIQMPSSMPYRRALPLTIMNAASARAFGLDNEFSYRLPAAIFGTLTIPLFFLLLRPFAGTGIALLAALLLSLSEWHIITSREARMYAPFLFFYLLAGFTTWNWVQTGRTRYGVLAAIFILISVSFHALGLFAILFALVPVAIKGWSRVSVPRLLLLAVLSGVASHLYSRYFITGAIDLWLQAQGAGRDALQIKSSSPWLPGRLAELPAYAVLSAAAGALLGLWAAFLSRSGDSSSGYWLRIPGYYLLAAGSAALACTGQLYASALVAILFLVMQPDSIGSVLRRIWKPAVLIVILSIAWVTATLWYMGLNEGLKSLVMFPFPYPAFFGEMSPGVMALFILGVLSLVFSARKSTNAPLYASLLMVVIPFMVIGVVKEWGGVRYLIQVYPFLLVIAAYGLLKALSVGRKDFSASSQASRVTHLIAFLVILSGVLGGHGIPQAINAATIEYGEAMDRHALGFPSYPDHRSAGLFVRQNLQAGDIVIAEDMLQQYWYIGRVDYWLRDPVKAAPYLYQNPKGEKRDIYVGSKPAAHNLLQQFGNDGRHRVWVITSSETYPRRQLTLDSGQFEWLVALEKTHQPAYIAEDGVTTVYCINCGIKQLDQIK